MYKRLCFVVMLTLTVFPKSYSQQSISISEQFIETAVPKIETREWSELNRNIHNYFIVSKINDSLHITRGDHIYKYELSTDNGRLVGRDGGEFGGGLKFYHKEYAEAGDGVEIERVGNVKGLLCWNNKVYCLTGLAHLTLDFGGIHELSPTKGAFESSKMITLPSSPQAFTLFKDKLLIIAHSCLFLVDQDLNYVLLFEDAFWQGLYPSSIVAFDEKNIFVGMRGGIVKVDLTSETLSFYKYNGGK